MLFFSLDCSKAVGIENSAILKDNQFKASSVYGKHYPYNGRFNRSFELPHNWGAWCAEERDKKPWFQVESYFFGFLSTQKK